MADFSMSDMPWLGQPADPAGSLARGVQAGSMIAQNRIQRASLAQRKFEYEQDYKLREAVASENSALAVLDATLKSQDLQMRELKLKDFLEQRQAAIEDEKAVQTAWDWAGKEMEKGNLLGALDVWHDFAASHQRMLENPKFMALRKELTDRLDLETERQKIKSTMGSSYTPGFETIINPQTGKPHVVFRSGSGSAQLMDDNSFSPEMRSITNPETGEKTTMVRTGPNTWKEQEQGEMVQITTPEGTTTTIAKGKPASNISTATYNEAEKKLAANEISLSQIAESIPLITPSTVGPRGVVNEAVEIAANIASPGSMATDVTRARQTFRATAQQQYAALKVDSQINKLEAEAMKQIADITKIAESDPTAREKYLVLQDLTALRSVLLSHQLGKIAPDNALRAMSIRQVAKAWKRGDLTEAEVERWNELHGVVK